MSRYSKTLPNGRSIAWGYDNPLNEYFLQEYKSPAETLLEAVDDDMHQDEVDDLVFSISNFYTIKAHPANLKKLDYTNAEIANIMKEYSLIPDEHIQAVLHNLPF
jgi:hypothetical protein